LPPVKLFNFYDFGNCCRAILRSIVVRDTTPASDFFNPDARIVFVNGSPALRSA
jgi:hypothetical protein